jgi:hypothetical protein
VGFADSSIAGVVAERKTIAEEIPENGAEAGAHRALGEDIFRVFGGDTTNFEEGKSGLHEQNQNCEHKAREHMTQEIVWLHYEYLIPAPKMSQKLSTSVSAIAARESQKEP